MKPTLAAAFLAASALTAAPLAHAGETTIIHTYKTVVPDRPTQIDTTATQTATVHKVVRKTAVHHRASYHHIIHRTATTQQAAPSAGSAAVNTSATVTRDTSARSATPAGDQPSGAVTEERKTVIQRDDEGDVIRHTRVIRQGPDGMTSVEHRSSEGPNEAP
jgi:hypothetical protein